MTAKDYLKQLRWLDIRVKSEAQQIHSLQQLAVNCSTLLPDKTICTGKGRFKANSVVTKISELQEELQQDMDETVALRKEIMEVIHEVDRTELQILLEKRYLSFLSWELIAMEMNYSIQHIYRMHATALEKVTRILSARTS